MAWSGSVTNVVKRDGAAIVTLQFIDGARSFEEIFRSSNPDRDWIAHTVFSRIRQLNKLDSISIVPGTVTPIDPTPDVNQVLFQRRVQVLDLAKTMVDMGALSPVHPKLQQLVTWIRDNVDAYFDSLG